MKKFFFLIVISISFFGCDKWAVERELNTLAGSVSSHDYQYIAAGEFDGLPFNIDNYPLLVIINSQNDYSISLDLFSFTDNKPKELFYDSIKSITTSPIELKGKAADVCFDDSITLRITKDNSISDYTATVKGWIKNTTLIELNKTKLTIADFEYDCNFEIEWLEKADNGIDDINHTLAINKLSR